MNDVVPLWIRCVPLAVALLYCPLTYVTARGAVWLALSKYRKALRENPNLHWTERARLGIAARSIGMVCLSLVPLQAAFLAQFSAGSLGAVSAGTLGWASGISTFIGAFFALRNLGKTLGFPETKLLADLRSTLFALHGKLVFLAACLGMLFLGYTIVERDVSHLEIAAPAIALLFPGVQLVIFRTTGIFHKDSALEQSLEAVFQATGVRPRAIWVAKMTWANALAYPLRQTIVLTERLLAVLTSEQVGTVVAHELGHLKEGRAAWLRLSSLVYVACASFAFPFVPIDDRPQFFLGAFSLFILGSLALVSWSRKREHAADGVALETSDAVTYARALERLYEANLYPATQRGGTHPSLFDRLERAGLTPDYPRPPLPPRGHIWVMWVCILVAPVVATTWPRSWQALADSPEVDAVVSDAARPVAELALRAWQNDNLETSIALYRRAERLDPYSPWYPRNLAAVLQRAGDCEGASVAADRAYAKLPNEPDAEEALFRVHCDGSSHDP